MRPVADIEKLYQSVRPSWQMPHSRMNEMVQAIQDEMDLPGPEIEGWEKVSTPNLAKQAALNTQWALSSSFPDITVPAIDPSSTRSQKKAREARMLLLWWMDQNEMADRIMPTRALHLPSLGMSPVVILPDQKLGHSKWETRDPQTAFMPLPSDSGSIVPPWIVFRFTRSYGELAYLYGESFTAQINLGTTEIKDSLLMDCLEYLDDDERVLLALGKADPYSRDRSTGMVVKLDRAQHFTGCTPVVCPTIPMFNKVMGSFETAIESWRQRAMLMSLATIAAKKSVFAVPWLQGDNPEVVRPASRDGLVPGIVKGGRLEWNRPDAAAVQIVIPMLSLLERNERVDMGVPASWGGENPIGSRTGRNQEQVTQDAVSGLLGRIHGILARSMREELKIAIRQGTRVFANREQRYMLNHKSARASGLAKPRDVFEHESVQVEYPHAGLTPAQWAVEGLQRVGGGLMPRRRFLSLDPMCDDPEADLDEITSDSITAGILAEFMQPGSFTLADKARVAELVQSNKKELAQAILQVQQEAQERQSQTVNPVEPGSPAAMPGLSPPGAGAEAGTIPPPAQDMGDLRELVNGLRATSRSPVPQ